MERRSAKNVTPRKRYTVDAFEGIDELRDFRSDDEDIRAVTRDDDTEEEFGEVADQSSDEDVMSGVEENPVEIASDDDSNAGEALLDDTISIADDLEDTTPNKTKTTLTRDAFVSHRPRTQTHKPDGPKTYTRGAFDRLHNKASTGLRRTYYFGPTKDDYGPVYAANARWLYDPTLPSRVKKDGGIGGMHQSFFVNDHVRLKQIDDSSRWLIEQGGNDTFLKRQVSVVLDKQQAADHMPEKRTGSMQFVMGPFASQTLFSLSVGQSMPLAKAWKRSPQSDFARDSALPGALKRGYIFNLGARIQCLDWAPNNSGSTQYLAVSVLPERVTPHRPFEAPQAPAFTPQPPHRANIQIWGFQRSEGGSISSSVPPQLKLTICTDWGDARNLKWCPMLPEHHNNNAEKKRLGLLAGVWWDGAIRVLDVSVSTVNTETSYLRIREAAFESKPPDTLCTCLAWISSSRIAAGCANGCIAIWDLSKSADSKSSPPRPVIYSSISASYILAMTTGYPSRPNILLTMSMSGFIGMTDLSRSSQAVGSPSTTVHGSRIRLSHPFLLWYDFAQVVLHVEDSYIVKGSAIRRLFSSFGMGRAKSNVTSLSVSPCHPCILVGAADGEVFAANPLQRVVDGKSPIWQQVWFAHEWRRPTERELLGQHASNGQDAPSNDHSQPLTEHESPAAPVGPSGISRMLEGFRAERVSLALDGRNPLKYNSVEGTQFATIYEEKTAITALAWNPNPHVGGWAAAGMGDGLLRVEDIGT